MNNLKELRIPSSLGHIAATIHEPSTKTSKLAILCPGYLDTKDYPHLVALSEGLTEQGYCVVRFDPTGTWGSGGDILNYTITQYLIDIKTVLDYLFDKEQYEHVLLGGHSLGGRLSILYGALDSRISLVLGIMASYGSVEGVYREKWEERGFRTSDRDIPGNSNEKRTFIVPFSHALDRENHDVLEHAKKISVPVILLAGELDDIVPAEDVKDIYEVANEPKEFILLNGIDHDYRNNSNDIKLVNDRILQAIRSYTSS